MREFKMFWRKMGQFGLGLIGILITWAMLSGALSAAEALQTQMITVCPKGCDYSKIQEAIDAAEMEAGSGLASRHRHMKVEAGTGLGAVLRVRGRSLNPDLRLPCSASFREWVGVIPKPGRSGLRPSDREEV